MSRLAGRTRLITLVGSGGIGNTRLVAEVARTAIDQQGQTVQQPAVGIPTESLPDSFVPLCG